MSSATRGSRRAAERDEDATGPLPSSCRGDAPVERTAPPRAALGVAAWVGLAAGLGVAVVLALGWVRGQPAARAAGLEASATPHVSATHLATNHVTAAERREAAGSSARSPEPEAPGGVGEADADLRAERSGSASADARRLARQIALVRFHAERGSLSRLHTEQTADVSERPTDPQPCLVLGLLAELAGDARGAVSHYRRALTRDPDQPAAANNLAWLLATRLEEPGAALEPARRAHASLPGDPRVADTLGWVLLLGHLEAVGELAAPPPAPSDRPSIDEAVALLGTARAGLPTDPGVAWRYATALACAGRMEDARRARGIAHALGSRVATRASTPNTAAPRDAAPRRPR